MNTKKEVIKRASKLLLYTTIITHIQKYIKKDGEEKKEEKMIDREKLRCY